MIQVKAYRWLAALSPGSIPPSGPFARSAFMPPEVGDSDFNEVLIHPHAGMAAQQVQRSTAFHVNINVAHGDVAVTED